MTPYGGNRVAQFNPLQEQGLALTQERALQGSPVNQAMQGHVQDVLGGQYLNANPYLDATYDKALRGMMPGINATFGGAGRTGSEAHASTLGTGMADLATNIYGQNYQAERGRQDAMTGMAPAAAGQDYVDYAALMGAGNQIQNQAQNILGADQAYWQEQQRQPYDALNQYISQIRGNVGQEVTAESTNPLAGVLGGGIVGNELFPQSGSVPWGAILGGIGGGLLG
jgi:hypothetical protein